MAGCSRPLGKRQPWKHNFAFTGKWYPWESSSSGKRRREVTLLKRHLRAAGDKAKATATLPGNIPPIPSSSASWLPRTHLLLAPEDHGPVGQGTTQPVSLCLFYAGGRSMVALQESERIHRYQPCNFNRGIFLISLCIPLAKERATDVCGKWRAGSWHSTLHTLFIILGSSSLSFHSRAYEQKDL